MAGRPCFIARNHHFAKVQFVFIIDALGMVLCCGDRLSSFVEQLNWLLVHTQYRSGRIVGFFVGFQDLFPGGDEFAIRFRRNHPVLDLALGHSVFFSVWRTVSMLMESTTSKATNSSANNCSVHLP